jgi:histidine ammonia-lyase
MLTIGDEPLKIYDVERVARNHEEVGLSVDAVNRIEKSREWVERVLDEERIVYGINTGFGELSKVFIPAEERENLQRNLILSHCTGVGDYLPEEVVRGIMLLSANSLAYGYSGIRLKTVRALIDLINKNITPAIPCKGSVGASGDLAPLAHMAAVLLGEGSVLKDGKAISCQEAFAGKDFLPLKLAAKEGLALINGTQVMTAIAALVCVDCERLMKIADIAAALSLEALQGTRAAFDRRIAEIRPHRGQLDTCGNILALTDHSKVIEHHVNCKKVQDAYSLRCISQVHGASKDALSRTIETVSVEMNAVTDNPIIMPDTGDIISGGNFHGQPIALAMDYLKIAIAEIGNISERRINRQVDPSLSDLPAFLTAYPGINSGLMILQYTAASLVSENKVLAHPASVDSIPTSANQEDHVSMGTIAARQSREMLENVRNVLSIEILGACQGIDFLAPYTPGRGTAAAHAFVRTIVPHLDEDRILYPDILAIYDCIVNGGLLASVEQAVGELLS